MKTKNVNDLKLADLARWVGLSLKKQRLLIATAESCTGGLLSSTITDVPGSSTYFERGFIVYSNLAKQEVLGVRKTTLARFGAVSQPVAVEMATGALRHSNAQISVAITGLAGPNGGTKNKPIGTVCFAFYSRLELPLKTVTMRFGGQRKLVKKQAVKFALKTLLEILL